jgi:hypothetical protein
MERYMKYIVLFLALCIAMQSYILHGLQERSKAHLLLIKDLSEEVHQLHLPKPDVLNVQDKK